VSSDRRHRCFLSAADITLAGKRAVLKSGMLERTVRFDGGNVRTASLASRAASFWPPKRASSP